MNVVDFAHRFPQVRVDGGVLFVDEGDVLTSAGTGAAVDICLHLVAADHGASVAGAVARRMVVPPHRDAGRPGPALRPRTGAGLGPPPPDPLTVSDLARQACMSRRTFARRFREATGHVFRTSRRPAR